MKIHKVFVKSAKGLISQCKVGLGIAALVTITGCVGYVDGGGYGATVVAPGPDVFFGGFDRGRDVHAFHDRGVASRGFAHGGGGRGGRR